MRQLTRFSSVLSFATMVLIATNSATPAKGASDSPSSAKSCMAPPSTPELGKPVIALEYDDSIDDASTSINAERSAALNMIVNAGFAQDARLLVDTVGANMASSDQLVNTQLQADGPNQLFRQSNATCKRSGITEALKTVNRHTDGGPQDLLGALQSLASNLTGLTRRHIDVVIFSNMINSAPPLDLGNPRTLDEGTSRLLSDVRRDGLLPSCAGWEVYVIGAGQTASGAISDSTYHALQDFWSGFFTSCGGQLVLYGNDLTQFPLTSIPVSVSKGKAASNISQRRSTNANGQTVVTFTLKASVLFATGSSTLATNDAATLRELLALLTTKYPRGSIEVTGYTDSIPIGSPGGNLKLSRDRASNVALWLTSHGVASGRIRSVGRGAEHPIVSNATSQGRALNRRVEVMVTLPQGSSS